MIYRILLTTTIGWFLSNFAFGQDIQYTETQTLFESGSNDYDFYRIPAMVTAVNGDLLAFAEARKNGRGDAGNIDIVLKISSDNGLTWTDQQVIWDDGDNTCGNPCPVVDQETGKIHLLLTHNLGHEHESDIIAKRAKSSRTVWTMTTKDHGKTWTKPKNITATTKDKEWGWYATGPGNGIQIQHGPHKGRLVIPCDHSYDDENGNVRNGPYEYGSHIIYSDDHGQSWSLGGVIRPKVNECQVVEIADGNGTMLMNMRSYFGDNKRTHSHSYDGGRSWTKPNNVDVLVEPICQASFVRAQWPSSFGLSTLFFLNPASSAGRHNMSLRMSVDEGQSWPMIRTLWAGPAAYSSMTMTANQELAVLYECGKDSPYEQILFQRIKWKTK